MTDETPMDPDSMDQLTPEEMSALAELLGNEVAWEELPADLEDAVVAALAPEIPEEVPAANRRRPRWLVVAAALIMAAGIGALVTQLDTDDSTGPTVTEFALSSTELAGDATGTVELAALRNGLRIILAVDALPPAPEGQFYEAWMRTPDAGVSAGTFHMRGESGEIELWAGVLSDDYPIFSITLEDEDGHTSSSGRVVMKADLTEPLDG